MLKNAEVVQLRTLNEVLPSAKMDNKRKNGSTLPMDVYAAQSSQQALPDIFWSLLTCHRDSGVNAIESLMDRRGAFDYIILEVP